MENKIQIRIVKESIIAEIHWMFHINRMDYFHAVLHSIQHDEQFVSTSISIDQESYDEFIADLKKLNNPHYSYYYHACQSIQAITGFHEIRIWTKKECQERYEALLDHSSPRLEECFLPLLKTVKNNEVLLIYKNTE